MVELRRATRGDLAFLMALEEKTCNEGFTGADPLEDHERCLEDPDYGYWILEHEGKADGFVILSGLANENRAILIKRIAMAEPGQGRGREAMRLILRHCFLTCNAHRVWLDVYPENERARRVYRALGFQEEGVMRDCILTGDGFRSLILMSLLENEPGAREVAHA
ncbi:MAG: GNAT family protein [Bryobacteraceae bacterium]